MGFNSAFKGLRVAILYSVDILGFTSFAFLLLLKCILWRENKN